MDEYGNTTADPGPVAFRFGTSEDGPAVLGIYALDGRLVRELLNQQLSPGEYAITWDRRDATGRESRWD